MINMIECPVCGKMHDYEQCMSPNGLCPGCEMQELMNRDAFTRKRFEAIAKAEREAILKEAETQRGVKCH